MGRKTTNETDIAVLARRLKVTEVLYASEKSEREHYENSYLDLLHRVSPSMMGRAERGDRVSNFRIKPLLVVFADIVGYSRLNDEERKYALDQMRIIGKSVLKSEDVIHLATRADPNTWGDGIVASFEDPTQGVQCACRFAKHLAVEGIKVRIGISWGEVRVKYNETIDRWDIDGESVNMGARLLPLAHPGEVLMDDVILGLTSFDKSKFALTKKVVSLKKGIGKRSRGSTITVHSVRLLPNK